RTLKNIRAVASFALCGFLLSFIFGILFSHSPVSSVMFRAILFAFVFACLALLISFVWTSILQVDAGVSVSASASSRQMPSRVDLVVQDEDLPQGENEQHFSVGENRHLLHESDYSKEGEDAKLGHGKDETGASSIASFTGESIENIDSLDGSEPSSNLVKETKDAAFVPVQLGQTSSDIKKEEIKKDESLDELPDLGAVINNASSNEDGANETEFSSTGVVKPRNKTQEQMNDKDTVLIAKAISTVLAKDKDE
ncbi:MAG: hypothetical protein IJR49_01650, partial [Treponema sp.]|nr:hypothetical protein [Treponema sp.]